MSKVDDYLKQIAMEKRLVGGIIDDRSLNNLPKVPYTYEYKELEEIETMLVNYRARRHMVGADKSDFIVIQGGKC